MGCLRLILGDQLTPAMSSLADVDRRADLVLIAEVAAEATYVRHHKAKIAFLFAAMRHFAGELREDGLEVCYVRFDACDNAGSLEAQVAALLAARGDLDRVVITKPGEWRLLDQMQGWQDRLGVPVDLREDDRFLCTTERFNAWAKGRKTLRMEYFYREMRRDTGLLMEGDSPAGGDWNYDQDNRKALPRGTEPPERLRFAPDATTREVIALVADRFAGHFGELDAFGWATTRADAKAARAHFIDDILAGFGDYQDAMAGGAPWLWHSLLSPYINCGLLDPLETCRMAERAWQEGRAPLNAVEGFIRQIIGWREFIRGIYWLKMPGYRDTNALNADRSLPDLYWTGETDMACMADAIGQTRRHAYAHHIQRLMVTGNFALLAGIHPDEINEWYLIVYADAYEWVELPNVHGMAIFADGGVFASKPYAASGNYISKMSDYCRGCHYTVSQKTGDEACPFNYLYWDFIARNRQTLAGNGRMGLVLKTLERKSAQERHAITRSAEHFLGRIGAVPRRKGTE